MGETLKGEDKSPAQVLPGVPWGFLSSSAVCPCSSPLHSVPDLGSISWEIAAALRLVRRGVRNVWEHKVGQGLGPMEGLGVPQENSEYPKHGPFWRVGVFLPW